MAELVKFDDLSHGRHAHEFVGAGHGDVPFSVIIVHSRPGVGPKLHRHPYPEVFVNTEWLAGPDPLWTSKPGDARD